MTRNRIIHAALIAAFALLVFPGGAATVQPRSLEQLTADSDLVVHGRVRDADSYYLDDRGFIVTELRIEPEEVLLDRNDRQGRDGALLSVTLWGGTVGDITDRMLGTRLPEPGEEILLMLDGSGEIDRVAGGSQGQVTITAEGGTPRARGLQIQAREGGTFLTADSASAAALESILGAVRREVDRPTRTRDAIGGPQVQGALIDVAGERRPLYAGSPEPAGTIADEPLAAMPPRSPTPAPEPDEGRGLPEGEISLSIEAAGDGSTQDVDLSATSYGTVLLPVVINQFPSTFLGWSPEDQYQMSKWNQYVDMFRVYQTPTGTYGYPNGRYDLAGWPSSDDLARVYGRGWKGGELGVTFARLRSGYIIEADIALNPAYSWTLNDGPVFLEQSFAWPFRQTMLHELGHVVGAGHEWYQLSIMNYHPQWTRAHGHLFLDDVLGVKGRYGRNATGIPDVAAYLFSASGQYWAVDSGFPRAIRAGASFTLERLTLENMGPDEATVNVHFYLGPDRSFEGARFVGATNVDVAGGGSVLTDLTITVPSTTPPGQYYLGVKVSPLRGAGDRYFRNNVAFSRRVIEVLPMSASISAAPATGHAPLPVTFTASVGGGKAPFTYTWDLDDGSEAEGGTVTHEYREPGTYRAALSVTDANGVVASAAREIVVTERPPAIEAVRFRGKKAKLEITGNTFKPGAEVLVGGASVAPARFVSDTQLVVKSKRLRKLLRKGVEVVLVVVNPSGVRSDEYLYTRQGRRRGR